MNSVYYFIHFLFLCLTSVPINSKSYQIEEQKNLSTYILKDTNDTLLGELLYIHIASSNVTFLTKIRDKRNAFYSISVLWFTSNHNISSFDGAFFGIGMTKNHSNGSIFTDLTLCVSKNMLYRCDDCYIINEANLSLNESFKQNFNPIIDVKDGGKDDILGYDIYDLITNNISPYNVLIKFSVNKPYFANEIQDLNYDLTNNLTFVYGSFTSNEDGDRIFNVKKNENRCWKQRVKT